MLIRNATLADGRQRDVRVRGETIAEVGRGLSGDDERTVDVAGKRLFPGMIDAHVHFRQPGYPHKETWEHGSRAAAAGGVTCVVDQPNTDPPTVDGAAFDEKVEFTADSVVDWGINGGVTADWDPESLFERRLFALGEVFLADSTGDMGSRRDLSSLDTLGRMNPPLRREKRRREVYERVADGTVDMIATDHAPHTTAEKDASIWDAPSGVPGVETALPLLLAEAADPDTDLGYERVRDLTASNPARLFDVPQKGAIEPGKDADLVLVDTTETTEIRAEERHTECGWTPFEGFDAVFPEWTMVRGTTVYERDPEGDVFYDHDGENVRDADGELV